MWFGSLTPETPLTWLEVTLGVIGGVCVGWFAHWSFRRYWSRESHGSREVASPPSNEDRGPSSSSSEIFRPDESVTLRRGISKGASTAGRVILHLASLGRLGNDEVARVGFTQRGMAEALEVRQGTLAKVVSRLEAAGVVEVDRRHVSGEPRRLKVYRLTGLGESVAKDIRRQRGAKKG